MSNDHVVVAWREADFRAISVFACDSGHYVTKSNPSLFGRISTGGDETVQDVDDCDVTASYLPRVQAAFIYGALAKPNFLNFVESGLSGQTRAGS